MRGRLGKGDSGEKVLCCIISPQCGRRATLLGGPPSTSALPPLLPCSPRPRTHLYQSLSLTALPNVFPFPPTRALALTHSSPCPLPLPCCTARLPPSPLPLCAPSCASAVGATEVQRRPVPTAPVLYVYCASVLCRARPSLTMPPAPPPDSPRPHPTRSLPSPPPPMPPEPDPPPSARLLPPCPPASARGAGFEAVRGSVYVCARPCATPHRACQGPTPQTATPRRAPVAPVAVRPPCYSRNVRVAGSPQPAPAHDKGTAHSGTAASISRLP